MKKQLTAVEFLLIKTAKHCFNKDEIEQAKAIEKEQRGYSEVDLEVAFYEGRENNLTFNQWLEQFKNQKK